MPAQSYLFYDTHCSGHLLLSFQTCTSLPNLSESHLELSEWMLLQKLSQRLSLSQLIAIKTCQTFRQQANWQFARSPDARRF